MWSFVAHIMAFASFALGGYFMPQPSTLPPPNVGMYISLPASGEGTGMPGGASREPTPPEPEPPKPEPAPEPEPEKPEPRVVRPTIEEDDEPLPLDNATVLKKPTREKPKQDSGLRGADAASAESAQLRTSPSGIDLGGAGGGSPFDTDFEYAYYVQQMLGRIQQRWQRTAVSSEAVVIVQFTILRDGSVRDVNVEQSSGAGILDRAAMRAVMLADPMPPLPNSFPRDQVGVHLRFTYSTNY